jgi:propanol-preferring alcohol dehydrogenase
MVLNDYERPLEFESRPERPPGNDEAVLSVEAAALCGSDLHVTRGDYARPGGRFAGLAPPLVLGHQIAGRVVAVGSNATDVEVGERRIVYCYLHCGSCRRCLEGRQNLCEEVTARIGFEVEGGFADYVTVPLRNLFPAPRGLDASQACVLPDAVATSYHAVTRVADVRPGAGVVVIGAGALGLYAVRAAVLRGARVVAVDRVADERLEWARKFGAVDTVAVEGGVSSRAEVVKRVLAPLSDHADIVLDFVGRSETFDAAAALARIRGRVVVIGVTTEARIPVARYAEKLIELRTSLASTPTDLLEVIALAERGLVEPIVHESLSLTEVNEGLARLARGEIVGRLVAVP